MAEGFFDMHAKLKGKSKAPSGPVDPAGAMTVSQFSVMIEKALRAGVPGSVSVRGELSNFSRHRASGHLYFTMKDETACLDCVMWQSSASRLRFEPVDGIELIATGRVAIYPQRGKYQLYATSLQPLGHGALELAFQQLRARLAGEGLFESGLKRAIPDYPRRIAFVTSRETAALQDILKVLGRFPWLRLWVYHVPVQGEGAGDRIAAALRHLNSPAAAELKIDAIVLTRGGGSLEDLWAFNEEAVARAVRASVVPVITGIGHEVDVTIADLAADYHAHTPTEAAQVLTRNWRTVAELIDMSGTRLRRGLRGIVSELKLRLASIERHEMFRAPMQRLASYRQLLDERQQAIVRAAGNRLRRDEQRLARLAARMSERHPRHLLALRRARLEAMEKSIATAWQQRRIRTERKLEAMETHLRALAPLEVLKRGYSITRLADDGSVIRSVQQLAGGQVRRVLVTQFADGSIESITRDPRQRGLFET
jgi:exodeoxyribonuclease VII large subunit